MEGGRRKYWWGAGWVLKEKAQRRDGGTWRLVTFTLKLCGHLSLLIFTVNVIGLSITLETELRACL